MYLEARVIIRDQKARRHCNRLQIRAKKDVWRTGCCQQEYEYYPTKRSKDFLSLPLGLVACLLSGGRGAPRGVVVSGGERW